MSRSASWSFTINNYDDLTIGHLMSLKSDEWSVVFGKEVAPTTGTNHLQGCIWSTDDSRKKRRTVERVLGGHAWLDVTHDLDSCVGYSIKDCEFFTNLTNTEEINRLRGVISEAKKYGEEYYWLGGVFFNAIDSPEYDLGEGSYRMVVWNRSCKVRKD